MTGLDGPDGAGAATSREQVGVTELFGLLVATQPVQDFLAELTGVTARSLQVSCGLTTRYDRSPLTVVSSDPLAAAVDEVQYGLDDGPCLQTLRSGDVVSVPDLLAEHRWGEYPAHALAHGVRSSLSLPLRIRQDVVVGAMNLYSVVPQAFDPPAVTARAVAFAEQASAVLTVALRQAQQAQLTEELREALASRSMIDQAVGIVMGQQRCDADTAFHVLRRASQGRNRKLRDIASDIVRSVSAGPPTPGAAEPL